MTYIPYTAWKVSKYGVFSGPNAGKYGPEKTPYLDIFHAMLTYRFSKNSLVIQPSLMTSLKL